MIIDKKDWISKGYEICSLKGFDGLKIEQLAKAVGISKSSFYHHFADLEVFFETVFEHHYQKCSILAENEKKCKAIYPELINVLLEHKTDILFNRQLRINRGDTQVAAALRKSKQLLGNYAVMLWAKEINLSYNTCQLEGLFEIATDDFYMQINPHNLNREFITAYFQNLSKVTRQLV